MKLIVITLLLGISSLYAGNIHSQTAKVSLTTHQLSVKQVLSDIEKQTDYLFVFDESKIDKLAK